MKSGNYDVIAYDAVYYALPDYVSSRSRHDVRHPNQTVNTRRRYQYKHETVI